MWLGHSPAASQESNACSAAYYAALGEIRASKGEDLNGAIAAMRAADPMLPGRWLYGAGLFGKQPRKSRPILAERPCLEQAKAAGRMRCVRYGAPVEPTELPMPTELDIAPAPTADETKILKSVADLVDGRGAIPDVGPNGRQTWLATRAASDLKSYISQPPHVALCSGGKEVTEFYSNALQPLQKRADDVAALSRRARKLAAERVVSANPAVDAPATVAGAAMTAPGAASSVSTSVDAARLSLVAMVAEAARGVLSADDIETIRAERYALAALRRAKPMLIQAQVDARISNDTSRQDRVLAVGRAMRMIEAAAYADEYAARYATFSATVIALPGQIRAAHDRACVCGP